MKLNNPALPIAIYIARTCRPTFNKIRHKNYNVFFIKRSPTFAPLTEHNKTAHQNDGSNLVKR